MSKNTIKKHREGQGLPPCPFCGCGEAGTQWHHGYWSITCGYWHDGTPSNHCFQDFGEFETEEEAIAWWCKRAPLCVNENLHYENNSGFEEMKPIEDGIC